jgi:hypothetical protein
MDLHRAVQLPGQQTHNLQSKRVGFEEVESGRETDKGIGDRKPDHAFPVPGAPNQDVPFPIAGKGVFQGIGNKLVDNQSARNCFVYPKVNVTNLHFYPDSHRIHNGGATEGIDQFAHIAGEIDV